MKYLGCVQPPHNTTCHLQRCYNLLPEIFMGKGESVLLCFTLDIFIEIIIVIITLPCFHPDTGHRVISSDRAVHTLMFRTLPTDFNSESFTLVSKWISIDLTLNSNVACLIVYHYFYTYKSNNAKSHISTYLMLLSIEIFRSQSSAFPRDNLEGPVQIVQSPGESSV